MKTVLAVGLIVSGASALGFVSFIIWAHNMYAVGVAPHAVWFLAAWVLACAALVAMGVWLLQRR